MNKSAGDSIRANAAKVRQRRAQESTSETTPTDPPPATASSTSRPAVRTRRVRRTVDLTVNRHRELGRWCDEQADELGLTRVTSQDVLSALVDELLTSDAVQQAVHDRIRTTRS